MQFNSFSYILLFLPLTAAVYFLASRYRVYAGKLALVLAGAVFYALGGWKSAVVLAVSLAVNFAFAKAMEKTSVPGRALLAVPVVLNAALLFVFKYTGFVLTNLNALGASFAPPELMLPLGISFFTFQQVAYLAAVYKKELLRADALDYLAYILYFPKLLMGPLMDPVDFVTQLNNASLKRPNAENIAAGLKLFSFGLFKKLLLADTFAKAVAWGFANTETATAADWLLVMLFYTFEIYFDFSGYTDMATGSSLILNITLPINFDSPYRALSIRDFWKRWHISLTKFFTRYIYIPLGGSRRGLRRTIANTMLVFLVSGLWHGANWTFILWGLLHGVFMVFDRLFEKEREFRLSTGALVSHIRAHQHSLAALPRRVCFRVARYTAHRIPAGEHRGQLRASCRLPASGICLPVRRPPVPSASVSRRDMGRTLSRFLLCLFSHGTQQL